MGCVVCILMAAHFESVGTNASIFVKHSLSSPSNDGVQTLLTPTFQSVSDGNAITCVSTNSTPIRYARCPCSRCQYCWSKNCDIAKYEGRCRVCVVYSFRLENPIRVTAQLSTDFSTSLYILNTEMLAKLNKLR